LKSTLWIHRQNTRERGGNPASATSKLERIDTISEPPVEYDENVHLFTNALVQRFDWQKFAALAT
jgi:hypothetical protein